jgi:hypothetical protein
MSNYPIVHFYVRKFNCEGKLINFHDDSCVSASYSNEMVWELDSSHNHAGNCGESTNQIRIVNLAAMSSNLKLHPVDWKTCRL